MLGESTLADVKEIDPYFQFSNRYESTKVFSYCYVNEKIVLSMRSAKSEDTESDYDDYIVESIELSNVDYYLDAYEFYNGRYSFIDYNGEEITVNYTDGTSETFVYGYDEEAGQKREITLFGNNHHIAIYQSELFITL